MSTIFYNLEEAVQSAVPQPSSFSASFQRTSKKRKRMDGIDIYVESTEVDGHDDISQFRRIRLRTRKFLKRYNQQSQNQNHGLDYDQIGVDLYDRTPYLSPPSKIYYTSSPLLPKNDQKLQRGPLVASCLPFLITLPTNHHRKKPSNSNANMRNHAASNARACVPYNSSCSAPQSPTRPTYRTTPQWRRACSNRISMSTPKSNIRTRRPTQAPRI